MANKDIERPNVTITPCTANSFWIELPDGVRIFVKEDIITIHANGRSVSVKI